MTDPDMGYWEYGYYADGTLYSVKDANNSTITYDIDQLNRPTRKRYPNGANVADVYFNYDEPASTNAIGRLSSMIDDSGSARLHYDSSGRVTSNVKHIDGIDYTIGKAYDGLGRMTSITYPDNESVGYLYDTAGNLSDIDGYAVFTGYNAVGQPATITYANGIVSNYRYYPNNYRLFSSRTDRLQTPIQSRAYNYDPIGNISSVLDLVNPSTPHNATYGTVNYTLDPTRAHAVGSVNGTTFHYDNNGNMTSDGTRTVVYTPDNLPYSITYNGATTRFVYDGNGQRVKKIAGSNKQYIGKLYECVDYVNCSKYIFAGNTRIALEDDHGTTYYYHPDHLGSTSVVTDDFGNTLEQIAYYPFGETRSDNGSHLLNHKYTQQELDSETNLYDHGARMYAPEIGRFVSPDTASPNIRNPQSINPYAYCGNNPLKYKDPTGRSWFHVVTVIPGSFVGWAFGGMNPYQAMKYQWNLDQRDLSNYGPDAMARHATTGETQSWGNAMGAAWDNFTSKVGNIDSVNVNSRSDYLRGDNSVAEANHTFADIISHFGSPWTESVANSPVLSGVHYLLNDIILGAITAPIAATESILSNLYAGITGLFGNNNTSYGQNTADITGQGNASNTGNSYNPPVLSDGTTTSGSSSGYSSSSGTSGSGGGGFWSWVSSLFD